MFIAFSCRHEGFFSLNDSELYAKFTETLDSAFRMYTHIDQITVVDSDLKYFLSQRVKS